MVIIGYFIISRFGFELNTLLTENHNPAVNWGVTVLIRYKYNYTVNSRVNQADVFV